MVVSDWMTFLIVCPLVGLAGFVDALKAAFDAGDWQELGASDPGLASGDYKLQVGDLDNRSSLQFIDPKGHTLTQSQNDALVAVFQAAFSK